MLIYNRLLIMKHSHKHKRKHRSRSQSQSSMSSSQSQERRRKTSKKDRKKDKSSDKHKHRHRSRSSQRQKSRKEHQNSKDKYESRTVKYDKAQEKGYQKPQSNDPKQLVNQYSDPDNKRISLQKNPQQPQIAIEAQGQTKPAKQLSCFEPSGILLEYYNSREGVSMRFHEPPESREPTDQWRMYIFKGEQVLAPIILNKSCYLIGKDQRIADILAENPSISRQHCVIQFRLVQKRLAQGEFIETIKPYVMDLQSTNGTLLNDEKIEPGRYYELLHRDVLKFGFSDREYVIVKWEENNEGNNEE